MSEYIIELPDSGAADEFVAKMGVEDCRIYGYRLTGEIVRCRDCVYFDAYGNTFGWCAFHDIDCSERRYCAWGERKEVD